MERIDIDRIIEMAWEDRTPFEAITFQFGISEAETIKTMDMLMGKSESGARRDWLEERGNEVEADI